MTRAVVLLLAAGEGARIGRGAKAFLPLRGRAIVAVAAENAAQCPEVGALVVAVPRGFEDEARRSVDVAKPVTIVTGGSRRQDSVRLALDAVPPEFDVAVCHDAARPFAGPELFTSVIAGLSEGDGVIPALPPPDTVKRVRNGYVEETLPREDLRLVQTPQAFVAAALREAHRRALAEGVHRTDDAALLEWAGFRVRVVPGEPSNFKITAPEDLARAEQVLIGVPSAGA